MLIYLCISFCLYFHKPTGRKKGFFVLRIRLEGARELFAYVSVGSAAAAAAAADAAGGGVGVGELLGS